MEIETGRLKIRGPQTDSSRQMGFTCRGENTPRCVFPKRYLRKDNRESGGGGREKRTRFGFDVGIRLNRFLRIYFRVHGLVVRRPIWDFRVSLGVTSKSFIC